MADRIVITEEDGAPGLPHPDSAEIMELVRDESVRAVYRVLYERLDDPPTMQEIRRILGPAIGSPEQLDRRKRDLHPFFRIEQVRQGREVRFRLAGRKAASESRRLGISARVRAQVLQFGRCDMCGRTVKDHGVVLHVDHKLPQAWGGTDHISNLQPLCEECNGGKKDHFATLDHLGPQIAAATKHESPHVRIGELLKAVYPNEVRSDIVEMVAHSVSYQSEWRKRLRELRELGWDYETRREHDGYRMQVFWRLTRSTPWPAGDVSAIIRRLEAERKAREASKKS